MVAVEGEAVVMGGTRVAGELGKDAEEVGGLEEEEGDPLVLVPQSMVVIRKLLDLVSWGVAEGVGRLVVKEEVLVRCLLWGGQVAWLRLLLWEEEVLLAKSLLLLDLAEVASRALAGEVASLQEEEGAEEREEEGGSRPATGPSPLTIIVTSPRSCPGGPHQWCTSASARR